MNQQIKQQWIEALRSGQYEQCPSELRNQSDEYCVNGVLCALHSQAHGGMGWSNIGLRHAWFYLAHHSFPVQEVRYWADITTDELETLEALNDARNSAARLDFEELALYIEANL